MGAPGRADQLVIGAASSLLVRPAAFLVIIIAAAVAATAVALASSRGLVIPVVVVELLLGVVIGPHVLGWHVDGFTRFFSDLGLALLFFFAGYEIEPGRIRGEPLRLGLIGWGISLVLAYSLAAYPLLAYPLDG